jgi:hypothetical protein
VNFVSPLKIVGFVETVGFFLGFFSINYNL